MARTPIKYEIPQGAEVSSCHGCENKIVWVQTKAGRAMPVDPDGTPHWATCPNAKDFKKR